ncbi:phage tail sheath subtilisin-like domain-containing protein [Roseicella sp. DB1501]|uniref:phage tail sheath subtilisin-like domain-containing protein n=1 Tax=Roseicella sp. DB1501 TaxID=2730925 RepID=UPI001492B2CB|nr:phage tail sheath subtilisin-like domain-containing protein [Roseicella sp. DB1501]NOG69812.1 phage tail protein [Roseicella sp. DB1501]
MAAIGFQNFPINTNLAPGVYFDVDATNANAGTAPQRTLVIGQMLASVTATAGVPFLVTSYAAARTAGGAGSMLSLMLQQYRKSDPTGEVWCLPVSDNGSGTNASIAVTISGTSTAAGTLNLYVCGTNVQVGVASGATAATVATATAAAINALIDLPVTAAASTGTVTITARHKGIVAGDIDARINFSGTPAGESTPAGLTVSVGSLSAGTGEPTLSFANLGDTVYDYIITPYGDSTSLAATTALLNDVSGRWSWQTKLYGHCFGAKKGTSSALTTFIASYNDQHLSLLGINDTPVPVYLVAADYGAVCANSLRVDPATPLQNVVMNIPAPPRASRFLLSERNTLYGVGMGATRANDAGQVILDRSVTTYTTNAAGAKDTSYRDTETLATLQFCIRSLDSMLGTKFARKKLLADGTQVPGGSNFVTAQSVKAEIIAWYRARALEGVVQNPDTFARNVQAQNIGQGRVAVMLPIDVANQLRVLGISVQFIKS